MGHNVSKKTGRITEINSVSIRQSLANGDVEVVENGTLSGNSETRKSTWKSDMGKSIRRSLKPSVKPRKKREIGASSGTVSSNEERPWTAPPKEEPDATSTPVSRGRLSGVVPDTTEDFEELEDETRKSKRKKKKVNRPYRRDSVLALNTKQKKSSCGKENGEIKPLNKAQIAELFPKKSNEKGYESVSLDDDVFCTGSQPESSAKEDEQSVRRFQRQRSTTRRKSRQGKAERDEKTAEKRRNSINGKVPVTIVSNDAEEANGHGNGIKTIDIEETETVFVSPTMLYNILNDGGLEAVRDTDRGHIILFDTRDIEDYEFAHIIGARRVCLGEADLGADLNIPYTWIVLYDDEGHDHFLSQSVLTTVLDRLTYLGYRSRILKGGFQSFVEKYPFMCQTDERYITQVVSHYPSEILDDKLYLGCTAQARNETVLSDLGIIYVLNIGEQMVKPVRDKGRVMNLQLKENSKTDLLKVMPQVLSVITSAVDDRGAKILVTCETGSNKNAAVVALYLMHKRKLTMIQAMSLIKANRNSVELSPGISYQLQRCEKVVSQAY